MFKWLHHLLNPHCPHCEQLEICKSCEVLERQLEIERARSNLLLDRVAGVNQVSQRTPPELEDRETEEELKPIRTSRRKFLPFAQRQQMIDQQDLKTLDVLQQRWREIHTKVPATEVMASNEKLEQELLNTDVLADAPEKAVNS